MGTVSVISKEKPFTQLRLSTLPPTDILGTVNVIDHGAHHSRKSTVSKIYSSNQITSISQD